jgi:hypothetical protein
MGMLRTCAAPGCSSLTLGEYCIEHEPDEVTAEEAEATETANSKA